MGEFCSETCSEQWQEKNQKCSSCNKELDLLQEEYTVTSSQQVLCQTCNHRDNAT